MLNVNIEYEEEFKQKALYQHEELGKTAKQIFSEVGAIGNYLNIVNIHKRMIAVL